VEHDELHELSCLQQRSRLVHGGFDIVSTTGSDEFSLVHTDAGQSSSNTVSPDERRDNAPFDRCQ
jgi:hypothetical protein